MRKSLIALAIWEDGCLSICAQNGDNPEVDLNKEQTKKVYLKLKGVYEANFDCTCCGSEIEIIKST